MAARSPSTHPPSLVERVGFWLLLVIGALFGLWFLWFLFIFLMSLLALLLGE
jgi:hypothetical protein